MFLDPPNPDLLKVKLLITEATYIDLDPQKDTVAMAKDRGHIHLQDIVQNAEIFRDVGALCLVHFSDKYSPSFIHSTLQESLPSDLKCKVFYSTIAKERT